MSSWQRLSGYLNSKPTGPFKRLKGSQRQWYVFEESTLKLLAYRNELEAAIPDKEPLKVINIHGAVFHIDPAEHNQFSIMSDGKEHILQAETEEAMLLWLHVLQTRRNEAVQTSTPSTPVTNDDSLSDYKLFRQSSMIKMQTPIPTRMSTSSPFDTNDLNMSGSVQPRSKSIMLSRQDSSDVSNEMLSSPDYASVLFHSSWASNNEAVTRSLQLNHINNDNINNNNNMNMDNNNNNIKSQNRLSLSRSRSYDAELLKRHSTINAPHTTTNINTTTTNNNNNNNTNGTTNSNESNSIDKSAITSLRHSKSNSHVHSRMDQSPKSNFRRGILNAPIEEEENEDAINDDKLNEKKSPLRETSEKNNDNNKNNTNLICVNGKEENNSLEDKTEINQSTNKTMPKRELVTENKVFSVEEIYQQDGQMTNANFTGSDKNEKVIKRKISNTTPNSDLGESTTLKKNEKPRRSLKKTCSLSESDVQELEQTAAFTRQNSLPESYCTSSMLAKYQSSIILQNPLIYNDNDMDYESTCTQNGYVRELKAQLQAALDREACLRQMLASREAGMREIDQKVESLENTEVRGNHFTLPKNISATKLRDMIEDYDQKQRILNRKNQFLIAEIRELATIKHMFTDHANKMTKYIQRLNMEGCKWRREYVKLLQACLGATQTDPHHRLMFSDYGKDRYKALISELLDEARRKDPSLPSMIKPKNADYHVDYYGFKHSYLNETSIIHYGCQQLYDFYTRQLSGADENVIRWTELLAQANRELTRADLEGLCRSGVPIQYREGVWRMLIHGELHQLMQIKGPLYYNGLLEEFSENTLAAQHRRQISLDLLRTMPNNVQFDNIDAPGVQKLQEVLQAYSIHNSKIGYCQGMNFLAAVALLFLKKEDAFWCLIAILERFLPENYFNSGLIDAQVDQLVLKEIVNEKLPRLSNHLKRMGIDISAVTLNWFLAVFYDSVPFETLIRIWDVFLLEGSESLFRFAVAVLKRNQDMLLEQTDTISFWKCLKAATRLTYDVDGLIKTAFEELRPFPKPQLIAARRAYHYDILSKKMFEKKGYWQNVMKDSADEYATDNGHRIIQRRRSNKESRAVIQAITFYDDEHLWICHGDKSYSQISEVVVPTNCMQSIGYELDSRVSCIWAFSNEIILLGMMSKQLCAYSVSQNAKLWQIPIHDSVMDLTSAYFPHDHTNKVYAGLTNGELVVIENVGHEEPLDSLYYITISFIPISSVLLARHQLWCASGNSIFIFHAKTMDFYKQISISNNPLDVILKLCLDEHGIWIAVRGSSVIELWDPNRLTRILLFNIANETYLSRRPEEEYAFNHQRVTVILSYEETVWIGTGMGEVLVYQVKTYEKLEDQKSPAEVKLFKSKRSMSFSNEMEVNSDRMGKALTENKRCPSNPDISPSSESNAPEPLFYPLRQDSLILDEVVNLSYVYKMNKIVRSKVSETPVRFLVMKKVRDSNTLIISCSTYFNDDDAVLKWQRDKNDSSVWTNEPIYVFDRESRSLRLPAYMRNSLCLQMHGKKSIVMNRPPVVST
uniref:TBC1 domain family member 2B n=1 Tax=Trichobilharzia regenti TaxID=157069 RepID=A0AA85JHM7_TRIRE|nr:unnamed protein product [Trichobilharzia regenti]